MFYHFFFFFETIKSSVKAVKWFFFKYSLAVKYKMHKMSNFFSG